METGDLVAFRGRGLVCWLIRAFRRSRFAHVGVLVMLDGVPVVLEARHPEGVGAHALPTRAEDKPEVFRTGRSIDVPMALSHLGNSYSVKDALLAGLGHPEDHAGWQCAEWAAFLLGLDWKGRPWTPDQVVAEFSTLSTSQR